MLIFNRDAPLSELVRPSELYDLIGQKACECACSSFENLQSMILWGPPGSGKTSFAKIVAAKSGLKIAETSGVVHSTAKFKEIFSDNFNFLAQKSDQKTVLILDEIHHLNKSQQDIFLPHLESGTIVLIGTTTENPSFELRPALLSRCKVVRFERLNLEDLEQILRRCEKILNKQLPLTQEAREYLCLMSDGDARYLLNRSEELFNAYFDEFLSIEELKNTISKKANVYDKASEAHYNLISAFHKSIRGSDVDAALYWTNRMLIAGEDPMYILRRLIRCASEEVGLADPFALQHALAAHQAYTILGPPEGNLAIINAVIYVATAPKSNAGYVAYNKSKECAGNYGSLPVPAKICNAPTKMMKELGYNLGYVYDHDVENAFSGENFFPQELSRKKFYDPAERGFEREIKKRISWWDNARKKTQKKSSV